MIVPEFWAEGRVQERVGERQITVRRFGWSDVSLEEAQANADERTREAFQRIASGEKLEKYEPKVAYNGADGLPIREEIIRRYGNAVITRNIYGALCLNTPDVVFADVDLPEGVPWRFRGAVYLPFLTASAFWAFSTGNIMDFVRGFGLTALIVPWFTSRLYRAYASYSGGVRKLALQHIRAFSNSHPDWHLRVYDTPAGFRILIMHQVFDPADEAVQAFFKDLSTDPLYAQMCRNQRCFRARLSPKPWRIGIQEHLRPRPGYWPIKPEHLPTRHRWVKAYEHKAAGFASCRFLESLGRTDVTHPEAVSIQTLHDDLCRAHSGLPLA
ncbi:hypothetical protein WJU23_13935 [Prosthecobacter sp. SYSU 5D2]|uniref:hypothetical protein n=1 Tax=Prosthecobacter sp. SYSU 5D2 TaxID=3134134 RepID=UPI0031FE9B2D